MAYAEYNGRCVGRLMYFLYKYHHASDSCIFHGKHKVGGSQITLWGRPFANYTWDGDTDVPTFEFLGDFSFLNKVQKREKPLLLEDIKIVTETELREKEEAEKRRFKENLRRQIEESHASK